MTNRDTQLLEAYREYRLELLRADEAAKRMTLATLKHREETIIRATAEFHAKMDAIEANAAQAA